MASNWVPAATTIVIVVASASPSRWRRLRRHAHLAARHDEPAHGGAVPAIITVILTRLRPTWPVLIPLVFVMTVSLWAAIVQVRGFWDTQNWLLLVIDLIIIVCAIWVTVEAFAAMNRARNEEPVVRSDDDTDAPAPVVAAKKL